MGMVGKVGKVVWEGGREGWRGGVWRTFLTLFFPSFPPSLYSSSLPSPRNTMLFPPSHPISPHHTCKHIYQTKRTRTYNRVCACACVGAGMKEGRKEGRVEGWKEERMEIMKERVERRKG